MKKISVALLSLATYCVMQACNGNKSTEETTTSSDTSATATGDTSANKMATPVDKDDSNFIMKAASGGMMEVELGKIAKDKAVSQRVKDFGNMMVEDHSKANDELKSIASSKNITVPATMKEDEQKHVDNLSKKSGVDFDKAYMKMMVDDHKKDIDEFKKSSSKSNDADIKNFAIKTLPVLQKHLDSAKAIEKSKM